MVAVRAFHWLMIRGGSTSAIRDSNRSRNRVRICFLETDFPRAVFREMAWYSSDAGSLFTLRPIPRNRRLTISARVSISDSIPDSLRPLRSRSLGHLTRISRSNKSVSTSDIQADAAKFTVQARGGGKSGLRIRVNQSPPRADDHCLFSRPLEAV